MTERTTNEDDTYLKCRSNTYIYRYSEDVLAIQFSSTGYKNNRLKDFKSTGINVQPFVIGDFESVYLFYEKDIHKVVEILKPITRGANKSPKQRKREITEEQRQKLRERMKQMREKGLLEKNSK